MKYTLLSFLAASLLTSFVALGGAFGETITGNANGMALTTAAPSVGSRSEAGVISVLKKAGSIGDVVRGASRSIGKQLSEARQLANATELPSPEVAKLADEYGISHFAAKAALDNPHVARAVAEQPLHRGTVTFEDPFGNTHALVRPMTTRDPSETSRILVDVDNVVGDYAGSFRRDVAEFLQIDIDELPANPTSYDWAEYSTPIRERLQSGKPLSANLAHFRDWMAAHNMLEGFLKNEPGFFDVFNPFHRYFVEEGLYRNMTALPGAGEGLSRLRQMWDIGIVTKRWGHDPVKYGWTSASVPSDSAHWISRATNNAFDSVTVMGENKADFAGNVHAVFEDSVGNIEKVRATNTRAALRERAFAAGVQADELENYLAQNNTDVLGVVFRWAYNEDHPHLKAPNVVAVDSWDEAQAVAMAFHKLLTDADAGKSGKLHWSEVPGLTQADGSPVSSLGGKLRTGD